ncbi:amidase [Marinitoga hydrogenitolerans DSM 16785]|uniref:Amidase n=1 Tax=Marinitoga hydrogenitolerans (strain DSM 16785 / JCM 12826 / AT1271) TaxID=1122195 RepID=A0A1M4WNP8_MARH1|nr:amidase family protein [Marinitoga hydrogenitolerans]SHE82834.1 amidase [Marinitoga hydrogenitolerans DSM 16785]
MELMNLTIEKVNKLFDEKKINSVDLVEFYLERISKLQNLNAILEINPDAIFIAQKLDLERKKGKIRSKLHGIPIIIKGNIDTNDKIQTTAGAKALEGNFAKEDAYLVKLLRKAGAVILGKANLTEFANFVSFKMKNGYSTLGGQTKNPYGNFDTGGSSSGSAVAVAADLCLAAIGTETSGSILSPSSSNSCVGLKPTTGSISRSGIIPISYTQDTAGPITRTVKDAYEIFKILSKYDKKDAATYIVKDYKPKFSEIKDYKGMIFGYSEDHIKWLEDEKRDAFFEALKKVEKLGGKIIKVKFENLDKISNINVLYYEFKHGINNYLKDKDLEVKTLNDIIKYNYKNPRAIKYGQNILIKSDGTNINDKEYLESLLNDRKYSRKLGIDKIIEEHNLTALIFPANYGAGIAAKAGYPSITVPCSYINGEPFGLTFTARFLEEEKLFSLAQCYEQSYNVRKLPKIITSYNEFKEKYKI